MVHHSLNHGLPLATPLFPPNPPHNTHKHPSTHHIKSNTTSLPPKYPFSTSLHQHHHHHLMAHTYRGRRVRTLTQSPSRSQPSLAPPPRTRHGSAIPSPPPPHQSTSPTPRQPRTLDAPPLLRRGTTSTLLGWPWLMDGNGRVHGLSKQTGAGVCIYSTVLYVPFVPAAMGERAGRQLCGAHGGSLPRRPSALQTHTPHPASPSRIASLPPSPERWEGYVMSGCVRCGRKGVLCCLTHMAEAKGRQKDKTRDGRTHARTHDR